MHKNGNKRKIGQEGIGEKIVPTKKDIFLEKTLKNPMSLAIIYVERRNKYAI